MAKPYLDALKGQIIADDSRVRDLRIVKVDINADLQDLPGVLEVKTDPELAKSGEFMLVMVEPFAGDDRTLRGGALWTAP